MAAHFELHIEQGPILEAEDRRIGIVTGVQAYNWFTITVRGRDSHTGATSFQHRAEALLISAKMILICHKIAKQHNALASLGILTLKPGSTNTVPRFVQFSLNVRSPSADIFDATVERCKTASAQIAANLDAGGVNHGCTQSDRRCEVEWQKDF
jgi:acetylornithine deacetylase/succinyl-diaminopimelate desuccinylase-like protein